MTLCVVNVLKYPTYIINDNALEMHCCWYTLLYHSTLCWPGIELQRLWSPGWCFYFIFPRSLMPLGSRVCVSSAHLSPAPLSLFIRRPPGATPLRSEVGKGAVCRGHKVMCGFLKFLPSTLSTPSHFPALTRSHLTLKLEHHCSSRRCEYTRLAMATWDCTSQSKLKGVHVPLLAAQLSSFRYYLKECTIYYC